MNEVEYRVSLYPSKFSGYQSKKENVGKITFFLPKLWEESENNFDKFVNQLIFIQILERICLERGFQRFRIKNRCNPCKMLKYAKFIMYCIGS